MHNLRQRYGEWALVTGATSGIGFAFAQKLAACGMNLVIAARRIALLEEMSQQLTRDHGIKVLCIQVDLSQDDCLHRIVEACHGIEIGMVVNNAGSGVPGLFSQSDPQFSSSSKNYLFLKGA